MWIFWIFTSVASMVLQNCLFNDTSKKRLTTALQVNGFNLIVHVTGLVIFGVLLLWERLSLYTTVVAVLFGVVTALYNLYRMKALAVGPMHVTLLIVTASMIIPTLSGVFFGEAFNPWKLVVVVLLLGFIYLSMHQVGGTKITGKWMVYVGLAFLFCGLIGVLQKVHQSSAHKDEIGGFLFVSFLFSAVFFVFRMKGHVKTTQLGKRTSFIAVVCGLCAFAMNYINLKLAGQLPSQLFFPLVNGSAIVLTSVLSVVLFKEQLTKRQTVGLVGGIGALIALCLIP